jgi:glutamate dehydrogenase (NAD(P)+)
MLICREALKKIGLRPEKTRVVVQGSGNVGGIGAMLLHREGYKIVSMSDMYGAIVDERGLDVPAVLAHLKKTKKLEGFPGAKRDQRRGRAARARLRRPHPGRVENQITSKNADRIRAKLVVEGANGPTTFAASEMLDKRGVVVVPDILANAGGVTVSYFEWVQDRMGYFWTEERVNSSLEQIMVKSFGDVVEVAQKYEVSLRIAAYILAIDRVAATYRLRGLFA